MAGSRGNIGAATQRTAAGARTQHSEPKGRKRSVAGHSTAYKRTVSGWRFRKALIRAVGFLCGQFYIRQNVLDLWRLLHHLQCIMAQVILAHLLFNLTRRYLVSLYAFRVKGK